MSMRKTAGSTSTSKVHTAKHNELTKGRAHRNARGAAVHCAYLIEWRLQPRRLYLTEFLTIETTALQHSIFDLKELVSIFVLQSDT